MTNNPSLQLAACTFIIMGATGDLTKRKLIPAIYKLLASNKLTTFALIGVALQAASFDDVLEQARPFIPDLDPALWEIMRKAGHYYAMDFHDPSVYQGLYQSVTRIEKQHGLPAHRLFYLATLPHHFEVITDNLASCGLVPNEADAKDDRWARVVYEKPFGMDLASARRINKVIARVFNEKQVFRIDHYLGKELVGNIALARFTNQFFEPLWNKDHIDSVQIVLSESIGIQGRGGFYDQYGALKDVVQNHLLQIVALIGMEPPAHFAAEKIRDAKAKVLSKIRVNNVILGQYEGYLQEKNVNPHSKTDTFAALKIALETKRWKGVPFYLKTGKLLNKAEAAIHIKFKMVKCVLDVCPVDTNYLTINIQPDEGMYLELNVKTPGVFNQVVPVKMNFSHSSLFGPNTPAAYETLLADVIRGDHFAFVRADEIDYSWKIIQQVRRLKPILYAYKSGSVGPEELTTLDSEREIRWRT
jgi:glucose-6-phosphate 1-dehydrogenase